MVDAGGESVAATSVRVPEPRPSKAPEPGQKLVWRNSSVTGPHQGKKFEVYRCSANHWDQYKLSMRKDWSF